MENYGTVVYREKTRAYVVGKLCVPHPDDESVPDRVCEEFAEQWNNVDAYAKAHPDMVKVEQPYTPPVPTLEELAASIRAERDRRLAMTDHLVMPDYPISSGKLEDAKAYRQALRDLPQQSGFPWGGPDDPACPWPEEPQPA